MIEIKSESGEDDGSSIQDAASTAAAEVPTAPAQASGTETSDVMVESSGQGETDREDKAATPAGLSPAAAVVPAAPAPAVESPRVSSRAKPLVDMFEDQT